MTKDEFEKQLQLHGHHLPQYWIHKELVEWLWSIVDPKLKENVNE